MVTYENLSVSLTVVNFYKTCIEIACRLEILAGSAKEGCNARLSNDEVSEILNDIRNGSVDQ